jgi:6-phosphogluconolactonase
MGTTYILMTGGENIMKQSISFIKRVFSHVRASIAEMKKDTGMSLSLVMISLIFLGMTGCDQKEGNDNLFLAAFTGDKPISNITPGWTIPAPPDATLNQGYTASVADQAGCTYRWSIASGSGTLINATAPVVTFTPTAAGSMQLQCVVTSEKRARSTGTYSITVSSGAVLNANPDAITLGQGTILLATFSGTTGIINPGGIPVTTNAGVTVTPASTTTYTLNVDAIDVATATVTVKEFVPKFVYVGNDSYDDYDPEALDDFNHSISAFTLNLDTGELTEIAGSPYKADVDQVVSDPNGKFLIVAGHGQGVYVYTINSTTGALQKVSGSPFATDYFAYSISMDPMGRFVYTSTKDTSASDEDGDGYIESFTINATTGVLTSIGSPIATGYQYHGDVLVHPSGKYLYAVVSNDATVDAFSIDQATGALTRMDGAPYDTSVSYPCGVAVDPTGAYIFAKGEEDPSYLAAYSVDIATGALTALTSSPFGPLEGSYAWHGLTFHPTKSILYTAFYGSDYDAGAYNLNLETGSLTEISGSPYALFVDAGSDNIALDRSGQFAFSTSWNGYVISRMRVDGTDGHLTKLNGDPLGDDDADTTPVPSGPVSIFVGGALQTVAE